MVVDIGAGAATVAVALARLSAEQAPTDRLSALQPAPNDAKTRAANLKHLDADFRSAKYFKSLEDVDFTDTDRLLFTFSYVAPTKTLSRKLT